MYYMFALIHGVFSFSKISSNTYERMIELVSAAEEYLQRKKAWHVDPPPPRPSTVKRDEIAQLRRAISDQAGFPLVLRVNDSPKFLAFAQPADVERLSQQGPATPDHVIRTKPFPMLGRDVASYARKYHEYFERHAAQAKEKKTILDAAPRMVLD